MGEEDLTDLSKKKALLLRRRRRDREGGLSQTSPTFYHGEKGRKGGKSTEAFSRFGCQEGPEVSPPIRELEGGGETFTTHQLWREGEKEGGEERKGALIRWNRTGDVFRAMTNKKGEGRRWSNRRKGGRRRWDFSFVRD